ncbi:hypothetical protein VULLAG_LOCUS21644 [Vulpes lagopus]
MGKTRFWPLPSGGVVGTQSPECRHSSAVPQSHGALGGGASFRCSRTRRAGDLCRLRLHSRAVPASDVASNETLDLTRLGAPGKSFNVCGCNLRMTMDRWIDGSMDRWIVPTLWADEKGKRSVSASSPVTLSLWSEGGVKVTVTV